MTTISAIILGAGKGTRMKSAKPKVLQTLAGKPLLGFVLDSVAKIGASRQIVVYGFLGEQLKNAFADNELIWAEQAEQLGTGHAVKMALPHLPTDGKSLILYGDVPLIRPETLQKLIDANTAGISMLTMAVDNPFGLGRIIRENGKVIAIVEQKDATDEQKNIKEINSGIYCVDNALLHEFLPNLNNNNVQQEYYLTDIVKMAVDKGIDIATISPEYAFEIDGVNDRIQLAELERTYQNHLIRELQLQGVQFADQNRVDIRGTLKCGQDVFIDINCVFNGDVVLGDNVKIDGNNTISNSTIGNGVYIKPNCVIDESVIGENAEIGPFAHLRPKSVLADKVKIGNFVETKKSTIGTGSKVNHLSYVGDSVVGVGVNIGAGTITCNYDGVNKFTTTIGDNAFIGSNSSLVAPVTIGKGATVGAGSVITKEVPDDKLAVGRGKQVIVENWVRPVKK